MKKCLFLSMLVVFASVFIGCATQSGLSVPNIADRPANLPDDAFVKVLRYTDKGAAVVGIKGVNILRIDIYGRGIDNADFKTEGEWIVFTLPKGRWFNFVFWNLRDQQYHYVYVTKEDAKMSPGWMDESISTFQPDGWGAAMTAREFVKK